MSRILNSFCYKKKYYKKNHYELINNFNTSKDLLAVKWESFDIPSFVELLVFENSFNKAKSNEQHICFLN